MISSLYNAPINDGYVLIPERVILDKIDVYFVLVHEQSLNDDDLIDFQFLSLNSPFLRELLYVSFKCVKMFITHK